AGWRSGALASRAPSASAPARGLHATTRSLDDGALEGTAEAAARRHLNGAGVSPEHMTQAQREPHVEAASSSGARTAAAIVASSWGTRDSVGFIGNVDVLRSDESDGGTCSESDKEDIDGMVTQMALRFQGH
ncbi:hypothetical protein Vretimale_19181, partial [Volvox reticuliferus]